MKKRIVAFFSDGNHCNFPADRMELDQSANMIYVYDGNRLVGAIDIGSVLRIYITEKKD